MVRKRKSDTRLSAEGREILDSVPLAPPIGYKKQPSIFDRVREMVRSDSLAREAERAGFETAEEADDFDVEDETYDPTTPYEHDFDPPAPSDQESAPQGAAEYRAWLEQELAAFGPGEEPAKDTAEGDSAPSAEEGKTVDPAPGT